MFEEKLNEYVNYFNSELNNNLLSLDKNAPEIIVESIKYSVLNGGKRVRPVLMFACGEMLGVKKETLKNLALSIEFIHSYSLVHDDLPAMDNDDYRRGKLSTHKKFGEAYGILCGDALLNYAFEIALLGDYSEKLFKAVKLLADFSGYNGMIKGQVLDLENEKKNADENILYDIIENKTGKLLTAPLLIASIMSGGNYFDELKNLGFNLGALFQITDDILDVTGELNTIGKTPHKDEEEDKLTAIKVFGLKGAKQKAKERFDNCIKILSKIPKSEFLKDFIKKIYERKN